MQVYEGNKLLSCKNFQISEGGSDWIQTLKRSGRLFNFEVFTSTLIE